jgi:hypothetical protein
VEDCKGYLRIPRESVQTIVNRSVGTRARTTQQRGVMVEPLHVHVRKRKQRMRPWILSLEHCCQARGEWFCRHNDVVALVLSGFFYSARVTSEYVDPRYRLQRKAVFFRVPLPEAFCLGHLIKRDVYPFPWLCNNNAER